MRAAQLPMDAIKKEPSDLSNFLLEIKSNLSQHSTLGSIRDARARDREAVVTNVMAQVAKISRSPNIAAKIKEGSLLVVGAFYEISSGMVDFIDISGDLADLVVEATVDDSD